MRRRQAGLTLLEVMIAITIMVLMMTLAWTTIRNTAETRTSVEAYEERNHELRMALDRVVARLRVDMYISRERRHRRKHTRARC